MAVDNQTVFNYSLGALSAFVWFIMYKFFGFIITLGPIQSFIPSETVATVVPVILGLGCAIGTYFGVSRNEVATRFGSEVVVELRKVVWPTRKEVTGTTTAVLIFVVLTAVVLFIFDKIFGYLFTALIK